jgi:hypothetical protein
MKNQKKLHIKTKIKNSIQGSVTTSQKLNSSIHFSRSVLATPEVELKGNSKNNSNKLGETPDKSEAESGEELQRQSTQNI